MQIALFENAGVLPEGILRVRRVILSSKAGEWCRIPYPGHPKGCPNYGQRPSCPPHAPHIFDVVDSSKGLYLAYSTFDLEKHILRMRQSHPGWTGLQTHCVLYWQGVSRKEMRRKALAAKRLTGANMVVECPEGMGVNVYATCRKAGLVLEKIHCLKVCHHVAIVGHSKMKEGKEGAYG